MDDSSWTNFLEGDENAFSELYLRYFKELLAYGLKIGFDDETCKDAIHDVFYKIYVTRKQLKHVKKIESYLLHCLKNRLFDIHNGEIKINKIDYDEFILENETNVIEKIIENETQSQLEDKLKQSLKILSPKQRKMIYYHYNLNLSFDEISLLLDMSPEAVKKSTYRAIQKLKNNALSLKRQFLFSFFPFF